MGTVKKLIGLGVVTGVVIFVYLRSIGEKLDNRTLEGKKDNAQLV